MLSRKGTKAQISNYAGQMNTTVKQAAHLRGQAESIEQGFNGSRSQGPPVQFKSAQSSEMFHGIFDKDSSESF